MQYTLEYQPGRRRTRTFSPAADQAKVSIVTAYYNAGQYFEQTFNSVMNQTFPWFEWIIVNDGSTNQEDLDILEKYAAMDGRIRVIHQKNKGLAGARNTGIVAATTEYFVPLDADDLISPQYLECTYWALEQHPEAAWAYTDCCGFQGQEYEWKHKWDANYMKTENLLVATAMIRKKDALDIGCYKVEKWSYNEDWRFWLEMLAQHKKPIHINTIMFWYRRMPSGMLSGIQSNPERTAFTKHIIETAAQQADGSVQAIEYPRSEAQELFTAPKYREWNFCNNPDVPGTKILWLIPWMELGGADKYNLDAIAGLTGKGYDCSIITTMPGKNGWKQKFEKYTDEIFILPDFEDESQYIEFISYFIQTRKIQVLMVSNSYEGYHMIPWLRAHFPELVIVDYVHMEEWYWRGGGFARLSGAVGDVVERTWVCNSGTREVIRKDFDRTAPETVQCLYIGVDHKHFNKHNEKAGYLHEKLGLGEQRPVVLFPCRIHPQKRPFLMLEIAKRVHETMPQVAFAVVGDGPQLDELKQQSEAMGLTETVYCLGRCNEMRACYRDSDVTLICSLKEGLALTAYESCSMGVPVISSDVGGQADLIDDQVGAIIPLYQKEDAENLDSRTFPEEEINEYVNHIIRILSNDALKTELGKNARARIEASFSLEKMVEKLDQELVWLLTDEGAYQKRMATASMMKTMKHLAADYYTVYRLWQQNDHRFEKKCYEAEEVWASREWFRSQVDENAAAELAAIKNSASWRMIVKYRNFVDTNPMGKYVNKMVQGMRKVKQRFSK